MKQINQNDGWDNNANEDAQAMGNKVTTGSIPEFDTELDFSGVSSETIEDASTSSGGTVNAACTSYCVCMGVRYEEGGVNDYGTPYPAAIRTDWQVLSSTDPNQAGKMIYHRTRLAKSEYVNNEPTGRILPLDETQLARIAAFLVAAGLFESPEEIASKKVRIDWTQLEGKVCGIRTYEKRYKTRNGETKKTYPAGSFYKIGDPKMRDVPIPIGIHGIPETDSLADELDQIMGD